MNSSKTKRPRGSLSSHMSKNKTQATQVLRLWVEIYPGGLRHLGEETLFSYWQLLHCYTGEVRELG